ncbi:MAG: hypothetical protein ACFCUS_02135 [Rubrimonas sp.]
MFEIDRERNRLHPLERRDLADLGFRERKDLQEWLAARPDVFGEELLIIQKEFEGFPHSRERLDLLALDKSGRLVVIENKLSECTREIFGQAVPYAAYASHLTADAIIEEYGKYRRLAGQNGDADERISAFLGAGRRSGPDLNACGAPRIFLVASAFTSGVLMTAEWLVERGVPIECFKISGLTRGDDQFLQCDRLFPSANTRTNKRSVNSKSADSPKVHHNRDGDRKTQFWYYAAPLLRNSGVLQSDNPAICSPQGTVEATLGRNRLRLRVGGRGALIEVSASMAGGDSDQHVLRRLSNVRGMLDRGLCGATLKFSGGSGRAPMVSAEKAFDLSDERLWPEISLWIIENSAKLIQVFGYGSVGETT